MSFVNSLCLGVCVVWGSKQEPRRLEVGVPWKCTYFWIELKRSHCGGGGGEAEITGFSKAQYNGLPYLEMLERCGHS